MSARDFLVEIGTEELPPKALTSLSKAFSTEILTSLKQLQLGFADAESFATPRRLALLVKGLDESQADKTIERFGPAVQAAFDKDGNATPAAAGFAKSCGVEVDQLQRAEKDGVEKLYYSASQPGQPTATLLSTIVSEALDKLPIPKRMRWGNSRAEFVRPVHWVVQLFGDEVVAGQFFGVAAGKKSRGHRFHADKSIEIDSPANYAALLEREGHIIPQFDRRREMIRELVIAEGVKANATSVIDEALLTEVASLVEFPVALTGKFEAHYLEVPAEALILAMKSHQKTFYCVDDEGKLLPLFIAVSNIVSKDPAQVIEGNERVIRPRLADASFFFETDKQVSLESHLEELKKIVFQDKLGTVYDRSVRIAKLSRALAPLCGAEPELCERAAMLSKCDLMTNMVGEFADLQGLMGRYYALNDGEPREVADAIDEQYRPRFAGDELPTGVTGAVLALSEKLDTLCGLFAIGQPPTGSKDPFALRRAAIGLLRILIEKELDLDLTICIDLAFRGLADLDPSSVDCSDKTQQQALAFLLDRLQAWSADKGISAEVFQSVMALKPTRPVDFDRRVQAVAHFQSLDESAALAAANKRVSNLLAKQSVDADAQVNAELFAEPAEKALFDKLVLVESEVDPLFARGDYKQGLAALAQLRQTVDTFFDDVLVVSDEEALRNNRLALLSRLRRGFLRAADISYLSS